MEEEMIGQGEGPLEMPRASTEEMLQYKLTAAEEQVAETRRQISVVLDFIEGGSLPYDVGLLGAADDESLMRGVQAVKGLLNKALSAAPKRGRVLWEGEADVIESQEDKESVIYIGASSTFEVNAFALWIYGRPKELRGGQDVTVTVREAE